MRATLWERVHPANTGEAGAIHRVDFFAGKPAPTGLPAEPDLCAYPANRACRRRTSSRTAGITQRP